MAKRKLNEEVKDRKRKYQNETFIVREYLDSLRSGQRVADNTIERRLSSVMIALEADAVTSTERLQMLQRRRDLEAALNGNKGKEAKFIEIAASYSDRKGIQFATWREFGVPARVLRDAGVRN